MLGIHHLSIGQRLALGFALTLGFTAAVAAYAWGQLAEVNAEVKLLVDDRVVKFEQLEEVKANVDRIAIGVRNLALLTEADAMSREAEAIATARQQNGGLIEALERRITSDKGKGLLQAAAEARQPYNESVDRVLALKQQKRFDEARELLLGGTAAAQSTYFERLDALIDYQRTLMDQAGHAAEATVERAGWALLVVTALALVAGALLALFTTRSIVRPIAQAVRVADAVAEGDLRTEIVVHGRDETARLLTALQRMSAALVQIVGQVRDNAECVATASSQIAQGNADLSQRTEEQASNLQQTAASMEQINATVQHNADNARQAVQLAEGAARAAESQGAVMAQVVNTMAQITQASHRIADITGAIDGIAFQTNILALNAAVEAARAGEEGRGFAVVASEVRTLAQRSAEAAKEIKVLIGTSTERVEAGNALVAQAGSTTDEVMAQVRRVADLIGEMSAASTEQNTGLGQIGQAVQQLDQVTQQNAALVEESAAASESLQHQARSLAQAVSVFRLAGDGDAGRASPAPARPKAASTPARAPAPKRTAVAAAVPALALAGGGTSDGGWTDF
ncbi:methyl-accepting chemotaxis protein [Inhella crocodyli]|uniref:HAMP domain-containing protein n=1 Tax=Inhella crocodyli TaxID=2499851 RepID=A0A437LEK5_9BURK|nr:methyl-accepting chemotaxis protein [Inhella crocodyli]RVT83719.1 HAMP domain-containing protein [Inhella crocodyli]